MKATRENLSISMKLCDSPTRTFLQTPDKRIYTSSFPSHPETEGQLSMYASGKNKNMPTQLICLCDQHRGQKGNINIFPLQTPAPRKIEYRKKVEYIYYV